MQSDVLLYIILMSANCHVWLGESNKEENSFFSSYNEWFGFRDVFFIIETYWSSFNLQSFPCMLGKLAVIDHTLSEKKNEIAPKSLFLQQGKKWTPST